MIKAVAAAFALALFAAAPATAQGQALSAADAIARALEAAGGGRAVSLELAGDPSSGLEYRIAIEQGAMRFDVTVSASTGAISRLSAAAQAAPQAAPQTAPQAAPPAAAQGRAAPRQDGGIYIGAVVPRPPAVRGGPENPPISAQRAAEIARDHLLAIGAAGARLDYVYMDRERGRWVWSVEFDGGRGRDYEFYIDASTGAILKFSMD